MLSPCHLHPVDFLLSATAPNLARVAKQTIRSASQVSAEVFLIKCIRKGEFLLSLFVFSIIATLTTDRYVEMLERQQVWLVRGLRELYRRTIESGVWPGDSLELETNGHPLTHDLLARLGVLDQSKGFRFEEDTQSLCSRDPDDARGSPSLLPNRASFSLDTSVHQHMPMASPVGEPMSAGSEDSIKPRLGNDGLVSTPLSIKGAVRSPTSLDVRQRASEPTSAGSEDSIQPQLGNDGLISTPLSIKGGARSPTSLDVRQRAGEPMSAGSEDSIKPQPGNDGFVSTPLSIKGAVSAPTSLDVHQHRQQQWVGADMDALFHESDLLISADQTSFTFDGLITTTSSSETPIPLIGAPPVSLPEPGIDPESALNFDLASFGTPPGFWKTYAV